MQITLRTLALMEPLNSSTSQKEAKYAEQSI
jgi:hypothetical protein